MSKQSLEENGTVTVGVQHRKSEDCGCRRRFCLTIDDCGFCLLVPTNYRITPRPGVVAREDEDKNLGRWVNRQRSLYQAGKLRKDRQLSLEKVGLKWSMLATMSWDSMFETLEEYVQEKVSIGWRPWHDCEPKSYKTG